MTKPIGWQRTLLYQKNKQHSFQEIPLLVNGTSIINSSQEGNYGY